MFSDTRLYVYLFLCENSVLNLTNEMHPVLDVAALSLHPVLGLEILSNEYDDEPDLGSSSGPHSPLSARQSNVSSRVRPVSTVAEVGRYFSYSQPHVDHGSHALLERVAALEQSQSAELTALQQELRVLRAQVAMAAQTVSGIKV
ncbi:hypothetical protein L914_17493 [Phytophthora nicotianae]|uniref:Uncharacterized protein n=1 Tax=Phytophthora nicotianae TaxID=4792 RepID=W2MJG9_PHYNI|nr:hypothetical protein L914_17493 [Phytophthora nicotianae]